MKVSLWFILLSSLLFCLPASAQEMIVNFSVDDSRIQGDKQIFEDMQQTIGRYLNTTKFTNDQFEVSERIRVNFRIVVMKRPSADYFECSAFIQTFRPSFNATYETPVLNLTDPTFHFTYVPFQQMNFVDNTYTDNLTALLNYYAYIILGFDYDTFAPAGGAPWFQKAQEVVNLAQSAANESGWKSGQDNRNRYWLTENLNNNAYRSFHQILYNYHRQGIDQMEASPAQGRRVMLDALKDLLALNKINPLLVVNKTFLDAKDDEIVKVFSNAFINDKREFVSVMQELDPSNIARYTSVLENK